MEHSTDAPDNDETVPPDPGAFRERGVRLFRENADYTSDSAAYRAIGPELGCAPDRLRVWCKQAESDCGQRAGLTNAGKDQIKETDGHVHELQQANALPKVSSYFVAAEFDHRFRK